jgi:hypothetical protein
VLAKYVLSDGISQAFLPFRFVDVIIIITDHDLNIQNDVIGLVLHEICKSRQKTNYCMAEQMSRHDRGVTMHFFQKRYNYISRYLICIMIRFIGNCNYSLKSMLVDMGDIFFISKKKNILFNNLILCRKGETIHRMYWNRDYFGDGSVRDTWRPLTIQTIWCSFFEKSNQSQKCVIYLFSHVTE